MWHSSLGRLSGRGLRTGWFIAFTETLIVLYCSISSLALVASSFSSGSRSSPSKSRRLCSGSSLMYRSCLLYTSDAADEEDSVDLGGRRIIKKKKKTKKTKHAD